MQLIGNRVIIIPEKKLDRTNGGIFIPETVQEDRNVGIVAVIGDTVDKRYEMRRVLFPPLVGDKIIHEGLNSLLLYSCEIIAILD